MSVSLVIVSYHSNSKVARTVTPITFIPLLHLQVYLPTLIVIYRTKMYIWRRLVVDPSSNQHRIFLCYIQLSQDVEIIIQDQLDFFVSCDQSV